MVAVSDVATKPSEQPKTDGSTAPEAAVIAPIMKALSDFVVDLVKADGGELYLVAVTNYDTASSVDVVFSSSCRVSGV